MRRIVITGMGAICALGHDAPSVWKAMTEGRPGIGPIHHIQPGQLRNGGIAAEVADYDPKNHFDDARAALLDPFSEYALIAANEAIRQSGIQFQGEASARTAVVIGTGAGGETTRDDLYERLYGEHQGRFHPLGIVRMMMNAPASQVSMVHGITGPAFVVASACASSNHAFAQAAMMIRSGMVDAAVVGGTEACITLGTLRAWEAMRVLAPDTCRPFSKGRRGLVLGEGAAMYVLETLESAQKRGAEIICELVGTGMSSDAGDIAAPSDIGAAAAMNMALRDGGLAPEDIDYINAHGTGTVANDSTETRAIHRVFGEHARELLVSSTKSMHGHALGAGGALELVAAIGAIHDGIVPPTINYLEPDPACDLDYVPNVARERRVNAAISNSFAFGGLNAVVAVRRMG
ncbi:3-oxoacyl-[acyl-carrier-protein] synthase II [Dyella jiangningensis]|uniref:beta-ketoacyl-[acyl-carrier-protein] synthase family protein n=1 Tax=Dyella sp. AtDHG13 TaxID=1938897 RepID=UPI000888FA14|nr:beta-ketoacyl-[acyl-carrier-protein] synthase family protein [Dyella sp. AtDHG13]PXV58637.1 3-oxoacyl-[acyl-carrier-protein] synthase II [Dyella sp. AtDHG13]SDL12277.1 3-oxoacyl-[acyl-carrier-protein] synthase II [Dyella jiangningensis]